MRNYQRYQNGKGEKMSLSHRVTELIENWFSGLSSAKVEVTTLPNVTVSTLPALPSGDNNIGKIKVTDGTNTASVIKADGEYGLVTVSPAHISTTNSTTTTLGIGGIFTGTAEEVVNYGIIMVIVKASHPSATAGFSIQQSTDGTNWDSTDEYTINANEGKTFSFQAGARYFRIVYTNGGVAQTYFRLQTILKPSYVKPSSHRIGDTISANDDAELVKSVLTAQNYTSSFVPINASKSGNLQVTDAENGFAISKGEVVGTSYIHKFGKSFDFDTSDGEVTIWDGAEDADPWELMRYVYSTTADIDSISSSSTSDTNRIIVIIGQTLDGTEISQTVTLNGQTRVALTTPLYRVYRAYNNNSTAIIGHAVIYVNTALTSGIPTDKTKIRAVIHPTYEQTEMAVYTIPKGYTGYLMNFYASIAGASKSSNYIINLNTRENGKIFRIRHSDAISDSGSSKIQHNYFAPEKLLERTDIEITAQTTVANITGSSISAGFEIILVAN